MSIKIVLPVVIAATDSPTKSERFAFGDRKADVRRPLPIAAYLENAFLTGNAG